MVKMETPKLHNKYKLYFCSKVLINQDQKWRAVYTGCNSFRNTFSEICCRRMDQSESKVFVLVSSEKEK